MIGAGSSAGFGATTEGLLSISESLLDDLFAGVESCTAFESAMAGSLLACGLLAAESFADAGLLEWPLSGSLSGELTGVGGFGAGVGVGVGFTA